MWLLTSSKLLFYIPSSVLELSLHTKKAHRIFLFSLNSILYQIKLFYLRWSFHLVTAPFKTIGCFLQRSGIRRDLVAHYIPVVFFYLCKIVYKNPKRKLSGILGFKLLLHEINTNILGANSIWPNQDSQREKKTDYQLPTPPKHSQQKFSQKYSLEINIFMTENWALIPEEKEEIAWNSIKAPKW